MELKQIKKPTLYTSVQVRKFMGVSYMTFYRLVSSGKLKAFNISSSPGKRIFRFRAEDIQAYYDNLPHSDYRIEDVHQ